MHIRTHTHLYTNICIHTYKHILKRIYTHNHAHAHTLTHTHIYIYIYIERERDVETDRGVYI